MVGRFSHNCYYSEIKYENHDQILHVKGPGGLKVIRDLVQGTSKGQRNGEAMVLFLPKYQLYI